jgi:hypothetical protein
MYGFSWAPRILLLITDFLSVWDRWARFPVTMFELVSLAATEGLAESDLVLTERPPDFPDVAAFDVWYIDL